MEIDREQGRNIMRRLAQETGGRSFEVSKNESISQIYGEIEDELRESIRRRLYFRPDRREQGISQDVTRYGR